MADEQHTQDRFLGPYIVNFTLLFVCAIFHIPYLEVDLLHTMKSGHISVEFDCVKLLNQVPCISAT